MVCAPLSCKTLGLALGSPQSKGGAAGALHPQHSGQPNSWRQHLPLWSQTLPLGAVLLPLAEQEQIHQPTRSQGWPSIQTPSKLHRGRAGLHPKPTETSGETRNDFSSSSPSLSLCPVGTGGVCTQKGSRQQHLSTRKPGSNKPSAVLLPIQLRFCTEAARGARGCLCYPFQLLL